MVVGGLNHSVSDTAEWWGRTENKSLAKESSGPEPSNQMVRGVSKGRNRRGL